MGRCAAGHAHEKNDTFRSHPRGSTPMASPTAPAANPSLAGGAVMRAWGFARVTEKGFDLPPIDRSNGWGTPWVDASLRCCELLAVVFRYRNRSHGRFDPDDILEDGGVQEGIDRPFLSPASFVSVTLLK
jgi:hypothetical protein